jgi:4-hydroxybutyrate dehydrogenase
VHPYIQLPKILFEHGAITGLPSALKDLNVVHPLLVTDKGLVECGTFDRACAVLKDYDYLVFDDTPENPTSDGVELAYAAYRAGKCDSVVAVGGGSVIDTAKMLAALAGHGGRVQDFLGHPEKVTAKIAPLFAIPTTASSGSEVSPGCGIHPNAASRAIGTRSHNLVPRVAICDPDMTSSLPPRLTAGTGLDALSHCIEGFLSTTSNPLIESMALEGIRHCCTYVERAVGDGSDREARWHMTLSGIAGGIAIASGLGPAHAMANALGDRGLHHGMLCAISLPVALDVVGPAAPQKMKSVARAMNLKQGESVPGALRALNARVGIPATLTDAGFGEADIDGLANDAVASPFNRTSPYVPTLDKYRGMFAMVLNGERPPRLAGSGRSKTSARSKG